MSRLQSNRRNNLPPNLLLLTILVLCAFLPVTAQKKPQVSKAAYLSVDMRSAILGDLKELDGKRRIYLNFGLMIPYNYEHALKLEIERVLGKYSGLELVNNPRLADCTLQIESSQLYIPQSPATTNPNTVNLANTTGEGTQLVMFVMEGGPYPDPTVRKRVLWERMTVERGPLQTGISSGAADFIKRLKRARGEK